jgi:2-iminobutanoate/2-iminopropanoate deaminase
MGFQTFKTIEGAPAPIGPYSAAVKVGNLLFCAGQIALDPKTGTLVDGGVREQTEQVLKNLDAVLRGAGSSPEQIAMTTIFLTEMIHGKVVNELYAAFVDPDSPPARQTVAVKELPAGALVEISVIAAIN